MGAIALTNKIARMALAMNSGQRRDHTRAYTAALHFRRLSSGMQFDPSYLRRRPVFHFGTRHKLHLSKFP